MTIYSTRDILDAAAEAQDARTAPLADLPDGVDLTLLIGVSQA